MLPDYPTLKQELSELLQRFMRLRIAHHQGGFVGQVARHRVFEGHATLLRRSTGDSEANGFEDIGAVLQVSVDEIRTMTFPDLLAKMDGVAAEIGPKTAKAFFASLDRTLEAAGQVESAKGEGASPERFLRALERIEMEFDSSGNHNLSIVTHPSGTDGLAAALRQLDADPVLRAKYVALIERKKEAWRAREASRRLVG